MGGTKFIPQEIIARQIFFIREQKVMLDNDLARLYGVETRALNQAVKRNPGKFPSDFMFRLKKKEFAFLLTQQSTVDPMRSQSVTASKRNVRYLPYVFTEHGALMAANVLNSRRAVKMSVFVMRAFIKMREIFAANKILAERLTALEKKLTGRVNIHERTIIQILTQIKKLMAFHEEPQPKRRAIGFQIDRSD